MANEEIKQRETRWSQMSLIDSDEDVRKKCIEKHIKFHVEMFESILRETYEFFDENPEIDTRHITYWFDFFRLDPDKAPAEWLDKNE